MTAWSTTRIADAVQALVGKGAKGTTEPAGLRQDS